MSVEPSWTNQASTFPQKFHVQGPESSSFAFGVTQPGPIEVEVRVQGTPVLATLRNLARPPVTQQGTGLIRDFPLACVHGEYTGVKLAGRSKAFAASHSPCIQARCCMATARFRMGFRPSVVI